MTEKLKLQIQKNYQDTFGGGVVIDFIIGKISARDVVSYYANKHTSYIVANALGLSEKSVYSSMYNWKLRMKKEQKKINEL